MNTFSFPHNPRLMGVPEAMAQNDLKTARRQIKRVDWEALRASNSDLAPLGVELARALKIQKEGPSRSKKEAWAAAVGVIAALKAEPGFLGYLRRCAQAQGELAPPALWKIQIEAIAEPDGSLSPDAKRLVFNASRLLAAGINRAAIEHAADLPCMSEWLSKSQKKERLDLWAPNDLDPPATQSQDALRLWSESLAALIASGTVDSAHFEEKTENLLKGRDWIGPQRAAAFMAMIARVAVEDLSEEAWARWTKRAREKIAIPSASELWSRGLAEATARREHRLMARELSVQKATESTRPESDGEASGGVSRRRRL